MRFPTILLLAIGLALSPARSGGQGSPEISQETIDALLVLAASPGVDTVKLMEIALGLFPGQDIHQILDSLLGDTIPDYTETPAFAGPTGFEGMGVVHTGFEGMGVAFADPTAPQFEATVLMAVLAEVARRVTILDDSDRLAEVYRAAGGFDLPSPFYLSALGLRWYAAVEDQDYEQMAAIAGEIRARQANFPRSAPGSRRAE